MMNWSLVKRCLQEQSSQKDNEELSDLLRASEVNHRLFVELAQRWKLRSIDFDADAAFEKLRKRLGSGESIPISWVEHRVNVGSIPWRSGIAAAVVLLVLIASAIYFFGGSEIKYTTEFTSEGETKTIFLSDGSIVELNSLSSITYPTTFVHTRDVKLVGEAFFDVQKDEKKPFRIITGDLRTTVLGTSFNVTAYPESPDVFVTVVSGLVRVSDVRSVTSLVLVPGSQGIFNKKTMALSQQEVEVEDRIAWKNETLVFDQIPIQEALVRIAEWYDVELILEGLEVECSISAEYENASVDEVLASLEHIYDLSYEWGSEQLLIVKSLSCKR